MENELNMPTHIAIIMDGNRRWAKKRLLPTNMGHKKGAERLEDIANYCKKLGVKYLTVYAFSTENWRRSEEEVNYLMDLFVTAFKSDLGFFVRNNVKVIFSGRIYPLSDKVLKVMNELVDETKDCTGGTFNICLNYGGQAELVDAAKKIAIDYKENNINLDDLDMNDFYKYLYQDLPPVDLMIRTSGELRISNFMLYSIAYAELYFTETCFPDFDEKEFDKALESYNNRNITKGGIKDKK